MAKRFVGAFPNSKNPARQHVGIGDAGTKREEIGFREDQILSLLALCEEHGAEAAVAKLKAAWLHVEKTQGARTSTKAAPAAAEF